MWSTQDALQWLHARQGLGIKLGLDNVRHLLALLQDPHEAFRVVHVAGTNGKGSVTHWLADALRRSGRKVGRYTSPHVERFNERIAIDGQDVDDAVLADAMERLKPHVDRMDQAGTPPTFFEVCTALAFMIFQEQGVEWAVIETGLGGRLDATNVVAPVLTVITAIGLDHGGELGPSIDAIAGEKAGIMKAGVPCVADGGHDGVGVLKRRSREAAIPMSIVGEDYRPSPVAGGMHLMHPHGEARYSLRMKGPHQVQNAALAVAAWDALRAQGHDFAPGAMQAALAEVQVPGRLEWVELDGMRVLLDGAHNLDGAVALRVFLGREDIEGFHLIVGFHDDKPWRSMLDQWVPLAAHVAAVPLRSPRTADPRAVAAAVSGSGIPHKPFDRVADAVLHAKDAGATVVVVAGSLWLVGEARAHLAGRTGGIDGSQ